MPCSACITRHFYNNATPHFSTIHRRCHDPDSASSAASAFKIPDIKTVEIAKYAEF